VGAPVWRIGACLVGVAERLGGRDDRGPPVGHWTWVRGRGRHGVWLAALGWQVSAVDFSAAGIERGRCGAGHGAVQVDRVVADLRKRLPPAGGTFDPVLVACLHLVDDVLGRGGDWLAPGGALVAVGHARGNLTEGVGGPCDARLLYM
jgi:Methyltransferase domain